MTQMFEVTTEASGEVRDAAGNLVSQEPAEGGSVPIEADVELATDGEVQE